jgi:hypothetical protein
VVYSVCVKEKANSKQEDVKMKKRELSPIELKNVVELRQLGAKWTEIERETKVERRAAKRAYEEWQRDQKIRDQEAARFRVAAEAFHEHLDDLITLATSLVTNLGVPDCTDMEKGARQFFSWLLEQDLLRRSISFEGGNHVRTMGEAQRFYRGDWQLYRREKELLFDSLKVHSAEKVPWRDVLDNRWAKARDSCATIVPKLREETSEMMKNFINQDQEANLLERIKEANIEGDPVTRIAEVILREIWEAIRQDKLDEEWPLFQMASYPVVDRKDIGIEVNSRHARVFVFIGIANKGLAEKVIDICNSVAKRLREGDTVQQLRCEVGNMKRATEELREMLNPVKLYPLILRTRCDLCPA